MKTETEKNPASRTPRRYWAIEWWAMGVNDRGNRVGRMYGFARKSDRDSWIESGNPYRDSGHRETISASDSELRRRLRTFHIEELDNGTLSV